MRSCDLDKQQTDRKSRQYFRCRHEYHLISKCPKPPKDIEKKLNQVRFSKRGKRVPQKECKNGDNDNDQNIHASMAQMSGNDESPSRDFGDNSQFTNWILDSGATCHMTPQVSDFIPAS